MKETFELRVTADHNDADYITEIIPVSEDELDKLRPMFKQIAGFKEYERRGRRHWHNFPHGDCLRDDLGEKSPRELYGWTEDEFDFLLEYIPSSEYGIHTIESVTVAPLTKKEVLV